MFQLIGFRRCWRAHAPRSPRRYHAHGCARARPPQGWRKNGDRVPVLDKGCGPRSCGPQARFAYARDHHAAGSIAQKRQRLPRMPPFNWPRPRPSPRSRVSSTFAGQIPASPGGGAPCMNWCGGDSSPASLVCCGPGSNLGDLCLGSPGTACPGGQPWRWDSCRRNRPDSGRPSRSRSRAGRGWD